MNSKKTRGKAHILSKRQQCLPLISQSHSDSKITHIAIIFSVCVHPMSHAHPFLQRSNVPRLLCSD